MPAARLTVSIGPVRWALLALALGGFGIGTGEFVTLGLLPNIAGSLHVSIPQAGHLISAYALGVVVGAPLLTGAAVRLPRRRLLILVALTMAALNVVSALMPGFTSLLLVRFLAGLPHGAYFGVASVVAANLVPQHRRSSAMAVVFAGLTVANVIGVPASTLIGQHTSWRVVFVLVAVVEVAAAIAILVVVPVDRADRDGSAPDLRQELRAFRQPQIWLSLSIAMIGGGALFATFSYIAPMMIHVAGFSEGAITPLLVLFGLGMTGGNLIGARMADRALMPTIYVATDVRDPARRRVLLRRPQHRGPRRCSSCCCPRPRWPCCPRCSPGSCRWPEAPRTSRQRRSTRRSTSPTRSAPGWAGSRSPRAGDTDRRT